MLLTAYFDSANIMLYPNMHQNTEWTQPYSTITAEANIQDFPHFCYWGYCQSAARKMNWTPGLAFLDWLVGWLADWLQTPADSISKSFVFMYFSFRIGRG